MINWQVANRLVNERGLILGVGEYEDAELSALATEYAGLWERIAAIQEKIAETAFFRMTEKELINFINLEHENFPESSVQVNNLVNVLKNLIFCYRDHPIFYVQNPRIWYVSDEDFHYLSFFAYGKKIQIRHYKVFTLQIDNKQIGFSWSHEDLGKMGDTIRKECGWKAPS